MKGLIIKIDYFVKSLLLDSIKLILFKKIKSFKSGKILIFRTGSIGDSICSFPALYSIRQNFPTSEIYLLTNPGPKNVSMEYLIDPELKFKIINYGTSNFVKLFKHLKRLRFDVFIELPQTFTPFINEVRNMFFARLIGARYGFGWQIISTKIFKRYQERHRKFVPVTKLLLNSLEKEGLKTFESAYPLAINQEINIRISNILQSRSLTTKEKQIAIVVGAKRSTNRWPIENFYEVVKDLTERGFVILFVGGAEDTSMVSSLLTINNTHDFTGILTPLESAVLMSNCTLTITNDTGPMHLSYAIGTPVIAIFSARDYPHVWYPPTNSLNQTLRSWSQPCSMCLLNSCPNNNACMKDIQPHQVLDAVEKLYKLKRIKLK